LHLLTWHCIASHQIDLPITEHHHKLSTTMLSSSNNSLSHLCIHNNQGVYYLQRNDTTAAIQSFNAALRVLNTNLTGDMIDDVHHLRVCVLEQDNSPAHANSACDVNEHDELEGVERDDKYFVHTHGLTLHDGYAAANVCMSMDSKQLIFSSTILFNLALAYHKQASMGRDSHYKSAMTLYNSCINILEETPSLTCSSGCLFIQALVYNNMAHIALLQCDHEPFDFYLTSAYMIVAQFKSHLASVVDFPLAQIILNSFMLRVSPVACAA
jgi:tetratricopeptide (TPR) repeat protein